MPPSRSARLTSNRKIFACETGGHRSLLSRQCWSPHELFPVWMEIRRWEFWFSFSTEFRSNVLESELGLFWLRSCFWVDSFYFDLYYVSVSFYLWTSISRRRVRTWRQNYQLVYVRTKYDAFSIFNGGSPELLNRLAANRHEKGRFICTSPVIVQSFSWYHLFAEYLPFSSIVIGESRTASTSTFIVWVRFWTVRVPFSSPCSLSRCCFTMSSEIF